MKTIVFDTKPYDRESLEPVANGEIEWGFQPFRLDAETANANLTAFAQGKPFLPGTQLQQEFTKEPLPKCA